jgi:O-antigen/teichoic acid export membrane protein
VTRLAAWPFRFNRGRDAGSQMRATSIERTSIETVLTGLLTQLTLLVSGILVARILGVENRGQLALMALLPLILAYTGTLGLPLATTYYIAQGADGRGILRSVRGSIGKQAVTLLVVHATVLWFVFNGTPSGVRLAAAYTLLAIPAFITQIWGLALLQGHKQFRAFNLFRLLQPALYAGAVVVAFIIGGSDIETIALVWVATSLVSGLCTLAVAVRGLPKAGSRPPSLTDMYRFGFKGMVGWISPIESFQLDQLVVGLAVSPSALGLYVVAAAFTNLTRLFIPQSLGMVAYPHVASAHDPVDARRAVWRFFFAALAICCLVIVVLEALVGWLIPIFFGRAFSDSIPLARILLIGSLFLGLRRVLTDGTRGAGHPGLGTLAEGCTAAIAAPALIVGANTGVQGIAWALTISYGLGLAFMITLAIPALLRGKPSPPASPVYPVAMGRGSGAPE